MHLPCGRGGGSHDYKVKRRPVPDGAEVLGMEAGSGVRVRRFGVCACRGCLFGEPGLGVDGRVPYPDP